MTIIVFGATGLVGKQVVKQAITLGYTVKAFSRNVDSLLDQDLENNQLIAIKGSVFDDGDIAAALKGADAVISVIGGAFDGLDKARSLGMKHIIAQMKAAGLSRIVALGGLGVLNADENTLLIDKPGYPEEYKPVGKEHVQAYIYLKESGTDWTFVGAPNITDEAATGHYHTSKDYPPSPNNNRITAGDLAAFMLKEVTAKEYVRYRAGISN